MDREKEKGNGAYRKSKEWKITNSHKIKTKESENGGKNKRCNFKRQKRGAPLEKKELVHYSSKKKKKKIKTPKATKEMK